MASFYDKQENKCLRNVNISLKIVKTCFLLKLDVTFNASFSFLFRLDKSGCKSSIVF